MKKINFHFLSIFLIILSLVIFNLKYGNETFVFFGFAKNKETEIRLEHPVVVNKIYVTSGKKVTKGALLLKVTRSELKLEKSDIKHEIARLESEYQIWKTGLETMKSKLKAEKRAITNDINSQIRQFESGIEINKNLIKDLKSIRPAMDEEGLSPNKIKIAGLKEELKLHLNSLNSEIYRLRKEIKAPKNPLKIQIAQLKEELEFNHQETEQLSIYAPSDGVVGSIFCKVGEQFSSFSNLITFYEENPNVIKGYVLETLMLHVKEGDSIWVNSAVNSLSTCRGKVIGLGSRVVEIPERLRKNPDFKTYGREIVIAIPLTNSFLQNEKVVLKITTKNNQTVNALLQVFNNSSEKPSLLTKSAVKVNN